jgi:hypothetical protein
MLPLNSLLQLRQRLTCHAQKAPLMGRCASSSPDAARASKFSPRSAEWLSAATEVLRPLRFMRECNRSFLRWHSESIII